MQDEATAEKKTVAYDEREKEEEEDDEGKFMPETHSHYFAHIYRIRTQNKNSWLLIVVASFGCGVYGELRCEFRFC